jgi:methylthioribose-1-phosphate isomerase
MPRTIEWISRQPGRLTPGAVRFIDQTRLPGQCRYCTTRDVHAVWHAIRTLQVRGAPAIGIAAAMGVVVAAQARRGASTARLLREVERAAAYLARSRPTAVNLFWALDRMRRTAAAHANLAPGDFVERLAREALAILEEDRAMCRAIGRHGATLLGRNASVLTHCNAGGLATSEYGTALAPIYVALERGRRVRVFADETRPLLQGARLTTWELMQAGVDVTLICDNMAARVMQQGLVQMVFVGADRIAANGDTANKIGTYGVAVLAKEHGLPFYVLAPTSTFDPALPDGSAIPIEERSPDEVRSGFGRATAPRGAKVYNPAFDVTPHRLITGIVCEKGLLRPPFRRSIAGALRDL